MSPVVKISRPSVSDTCGCCGSGTFTAFFFLGMGPPVCGWGAGNGIDGPLPAWGWSGERLADVDFVTGESARVNNSEIGEQVDENVTFAESIPAQ